MQIPLSPYLLDITPVLLALEAIPNKEVPNYHKESFLAKYQEFLKPHFADEEIQEIISTQSPVYISYKTSPEEYLFWFSLKLSLIPRDGIQTALNYAHQTYPNENVFQGIKTTVLVSLENNWTWTTKSVIDELKVWIRLTMPISKSIFPPEYRELLFLELVPKLVEPQKRNILFNLIFLNELPKTAIGLDYRSMQELCIIPSLLKKKKQVNLSYSELAEWIKKSFNFINSEGALSTASENSIVRYLDSKTNTPPHLKNWLSL